MYIFIDVYAHKYFEYFATLDPRSYKFKCSYLKLESFKFINHGPVETSYCGNFLTL